MMTATITHLSTFQDLDLAKALGITIGLRDTAVTLGQANLADYFAALVSCLSEEQHTRGIQSPHTDALVAGAGIAISATAVN